MSNDNFINETLQEYLNNKDHEQHRELIKDVLQNNSNETKYYLWTLLMNYDTMKCTVESLSNHLQGLYCSDKDVQSYIDRIVSFNPKLSYISISAVSGLDMKLDNSLDIQIRVPANNNTEQHFANADKIMKKVKEVLTMILVESKGIVR